LVFYAPYAWSVFSFNYDNGQQPGAIYSIVFSMVVVVGNAIMYEVCARVSDSVQYRFKDSRETTYMLFYTIACSFNIAIDFVTTYFTTWEIIKGLHFRTYHGTPIHEIGSFTDRFESYAMQRVLAENTYRYAFPSTYLIPFLLEPMITIAVPYKIGQIIVRTHPEMQGKQAEEFLAAPAMEMGRYADLILNLILGVMIFWFPGGWTHQLFFGLAVSHIYIYLFDHMRVLRTIPTCTFASMDVDWWSQVALIPLCGMVLACCIFKANRQGYGILLEGNDIVKVCGVAFFGHALLHLALLVYVVPLFGKKPEPNPELDNLTYKDVAQSRAASWFSTNPIHCLRSRLIYKHTPACVYLHPGKEHILMVNEKIGCYFSADSAELPRDEDVTPTKASRGLFGSRSSSTAKQK